MKGGDLSNSAVRRFRAAFLIMVLLGAFIGASIPASANFHLMKIREVYAGGPDTPGAQFVELQMTSAGQTQVQGHSVRIYDSSGAVVSTFTFNSPVASSANGSSILVATPAAVTAFGVAADLSMTPVIPALGGKVCFVGVDCVSWGSYVDSDTGTPFNTYDGLVPGASAFRFGSDSGNSASDFRHAAPTPRNNAGNTTTAVCCTLGFTVTSVLVNESDGSVNLDVVRSGNTSDAVSVDYATGNGTALAGSDFTATSGTLNFASGETSKTINVSIASDPEEYSENFFVRLRSLSSGFFTSPDALVTIQGEFSPTAPTPPQNLVVVGGQNKITLTWEASAADGGAPVTNYRIYRGATSGNLSVLTTIGNALAYVDSPLPAGITGYYQVTALNSAGESAPSNEASATTNPPPPQPPSAPLNPRAEPSLGLVTVTWDSPESIGSSPITQYQVQTRAQGATGWNHLAYVNGETTTYVHDNCRLLVERFCQYRIRAFNSVGAGPFSTPVVEALGTKL